MSKDLTSITSNPISTESEIDKIEQAESLEERIDALGQEIMANAFFVIDRIKKDGKKETKREIERQEELQRQFKVIRTVYSELKKMNRVIGVPNPDFSKGLLQKIKDKESSIGAIVTRIDQKNEKTG